MNSIAQLLAVYYYHMALFHHFTLYFIIYLLCHVGYWWIVIPLFICYNIHIIRDEAPVNGGGLWLYFMNHWIIESSIKWFPLNLVRKEKLDWRKQYIFALHPHGMMPWVILPIGRGKQWNELFSGIFVRALAASVLFKIPICREGLLWMGVVDASRYNASEALKSGSSISVIVGGSAELLESQPNTDVLILKRRKGFVRLALENGADLVPVYGYGINDLYVQFPWFKKARQWFTSMTQVAPTIGLGRQWGYTFPFPQVSIFLPISRLVFAKETYSPIVFPIQWLVLLVSSK
jgi:2-acylglycerol O-acyltransferase 2